MQPHAGPRLAAVAAAVSLLAAAPASASASKPAQSAARHLAVRVLAADDRHVALDVKLPTAHFVARSGNGRRFTALLMDGLDDVGRPGEPGVPGMTRLFGVPRGAGVSVKITGSSSYVVGGVDLFPRQREPEDAVSPQANPLRPPGPEAFATPPFTIDRKAYRGPTFPARPANTGLLGALRDVHVGGVELDAAQYSPRTKRLRVFTHLQVDVQFTGTERGGFADERLAGPWDSAFAKVYGGALVNAGVLDKYLDPGLSEPCGEEMLVVTSAALRPAADTFAAARTAAGIAARVVEVGSGPGQIGTTNTAIRSFIRSHLNSACKRRPDYVVLLGDTTQVPTFLEPCRPVDPPPLTGEGSCNIASDLEYSLNGIGTDLFPDTMLGRIPAGDLATASTVVSKIVGYETTAPAPPGDDFFRHATITSFWQQRVHCVPAGANCNPDTPPVTGTIEPDYANHTDERGFTKTTETVRNAMLGKGYAVDRVYTTDPLSTPEFYYDGTPLPAALKRPGFPWNGTGADVISDVNAGRFMVFHRDHGWPDGWANPQVTSADVPSWTNGAKLPVVFSVNCASAMFDRVGNPSLVERLVQSPVGGAVAAFGDSRNSPSFANNHMALGFFDALFPNVVPTYGLSTPATRLGQVLVRGKGYMATQNGLDGQGADQTFQEHELYGLFGDPSTQMWIAPPLEFDPSKWLVRYERLPVQVGPGDPPPFQVVVEVGQSFAEGAMATLQHDGDPVGRGIVHDGRVTIVPERPVDARGLSVSLDGDGVLPARKAVDAQAG